MNFKAAGAGGCIVELVVLDADRLLDVTIAEMSEMGNVSYYRDEEPGYESWSQTSDWSDDWSLEDDANLGNFSGIVKIEPRSYGLADEETNPVWWVRHPDRPGMLVTLGYALGLLEPLDREKAVKAHLAVMSDLVAHERSARGISDRDGAVEPRCVACVAEPDMHAELLVDYIALRARELVDALSLFPVRMVVGDSDKF